MDLIPVTSGDDGTASGPNQVVLSERAQSLAKLRTAPVRRQSDATADLRLLGRFLAAASKSAANLVRATGPGGPEVIGKVIEVRRNLRGKEAR